MIGTQTYESVHFQFCIRVGFAHYGLPAIHRYPSLGCGKPYRIYVSYPPLSQIVVSCSYSLSFLPEHQTSAPTHSFISAGHHKENFRQPSWLPEAQN